MSTQGCKTVCFPVHSELDWRRRLAFNIDIASAWLVSMTITVWAQWDSQWVLFRDVVIVTVSWFLDGLLESPMPDPVQGLSC